MVCEVDFFRTFKFIDKKNINVKDSNEILKSSP